MLGLMLAFAYASRTISTAFNASWRGEGGVEDWLIEVSVSSCLVFFDIWRVCRGPIRGRREHLLQI